MSVQVVGAKLRYVTTSDNDAGSVISTEVNGKQLKFDFSKSNGYTVEVPIRVAYHNLAGKEVVQHENYAQHLLNSYSFLTFVEYVEKELVEKPLIVDQRASANNELAKALAEKEELKRKLEALEAAQAVKDVAVEVPSETPAVPAKLEDMTLKQLKEYATEKGIDIPYNVTAKQDVINFIKEKEA